MAGEEEPLQPIIIKKVIKKGGGHHGGAWKVAYADFVTAMMAFFLLLWLLNVTTEDQRNAISNYFDPTHPKVAEVTSGAGGVMGGLTTAPEGAMTSNVQPITPPPVSTRVPTQSQRAAEAEEERRFEEAQEQIEEAIKETPELKELAENLIVDMTPEGLRIQVVDSEGRSMFASGSAEMYPETRVLIGKVAEIITNLPNEVSVRGHTDSVPYGAGAKYTNWELSADRANTSRRVLQEYGFPAERLNNVVGKADTEHLVEDDPKNAKNRRISLVLLKESITNPEAAGKTVPTGSDGLPAPSAPPNTGSFKKTPGQVQFP